MYYKRENPRTKNKKKRQREFNLSFFSVFRCFISYMCVFCSYTGFVVALINDWPFFKNFKIKKKNETKN